MQTQVGLLLGSTWETDEGWAFTRSGSSTATGTRPYSPRCHSGGYVGLIETYADWPSGAYAKFTKSVDVSSGANRVARIFRGPGWPYAMFDDFLGSSIDLSKWQNYYTMNPTEQNGYVHLVSGKQLRSIDKIFLGYGSYGIRCYWGAALNGASLWTVYSSGQELISLKFETNSHIYLSVGHAGSTISDIDAGTYDYTIYHVYRITWDATHVYVYEDEVLKLTQTTCIPVPADGGFMQLAFLAGTPSWYVDWIGFRQVATARKSSFAIGSQTLLDVDIDPGEATVDNEFYDSGWISVTPIGTQTVELKLRNASGSADNTPAQVAYDDIMIMRDKKITIQGLLSGQKIELYDSGDTLLFTATSTGADIQFDISPYINTGAGFVSYFLVYGADGVTLIYTSPTDARFGGDILAWQLNDTEIVGPAQSMRIYKSGAVATPKSISLTLTLRKVSDASAVVGKLITLTTNIGTLSPTSATTDSNGQVTTTLTSDATHGWAIVKGAWAGDADYATSEGFLEIAVYDEADAGDPAKPFQVFVHGIEYPFTAGSYERSTLFSARPFSIQLDAVYTAIDGALEVIIYHRGVKDFAGRILKPNRTIDNKMILNGVSNVWKLGRRVINKTYNADPRDIINDLLVQKPAGVAAGSIALYGAPVPMAFNYDTLAVAIQRILDYTGYQARLKVDDTLDFAVDFGGTKAISFITGSPTPNLNLEREIDYGAVDTRTFLTGTPANVVSDKYDSAAAAAYGLIEESFVDKNLTTLSAVDEENEEILDARKAPVERITGEIADLAYAADAYDVFDYVTVTDVNTGMSGTYRVITLVRDLTDMGTAQVEFSNPSLIYADTVSSLRKNVKDLAHV